jgi:hypothetical protein
VKNSTSGAVGLGASDRLVTNFGDGANIGDSAGVRDRLPFGDGFGASIRDSLGADVGNRASVRDRLPFGDCLGAGRRDSVKARLGDGTAGEGDRAGVRERFEARLGFDASLGGDLAGAGDGLGASLDLGLEASRRDSLDWSGDGAGLGLGLEASDGGAFPSRDNGRDSDSGSGSNGAVGGRRAYGGGGSASRHRCAGAVDDVGGAIAFLADGQSPGVVSRSLDLTDFLPNGDSGGGRAVSGGGDALGPRGGRGWDGSRRGGGISRLTTSSSEAGGRGRSGRKK